MNFSKLVKEIIGPLLNLLGFVLKSESKGLIDYENKVLVISFSYDFSRSFEVDVNFFFKANNEFYTFSEVKEYLYKEIPNSITQITNDDNLKLWIIDVHAFLNRHLKEIINNHIKITFELDGLRRQRSNDYTNEKARRLLNEDVEKLWREKKYDKLVELLKTNEDKLDGSMKKKYEYALKVIGHK